MEALSKQAVRILRLFGSDASRVYSTAGPEQEYFLIDKHFYFARPDLINAGRTLFGARPPKGQEMEDHYFGAIPERVLACMLETETELYKLGVPVKTRHNEVSPAQYEIAVTFENANVATDHNMLVMETMKRVADRYGLQLLLHEKPFAGVNGSGKHLNWSLADDHGQQPAQARRDAARERPVPDLPGGRHPRRRPARRPAARGRRQRAQRPSARAPTRPRRRSSRSSWATCSRTSSSRSRRAAPSRPRPAASCKIGVSVLPTLPRDAGDRNRTSPFAFTGNKFEFRAVGSSQSVAGPIVVLNTIVAESLDDIATQLEQAVAAKKDLNAEIQTLLQNVVKESKQVIFNGDNYSEAWHAEAERRGLPNRRTTIDSLPDLVSPKSVKLFTKYGIFNERELHSRYEIFLESYKKTINIESQLTIQIAHADDPARGAAVPVAGRRGHRQPQGHRRRPSPSRRSALLSELVEAIDDLQEATDRLTAATEEAGEGDSLAHAKHSRDAIIPAMNAVRAAGDRLEGLVADDLWPLPTYQEMLFIK